MTNLWYILKHRKPIPTTSLAKASMQFDKQNRIRKIRAFPYGNYHLSTIFTVLDHQYLKDGPPLLFETMLFKNGEQIDYERTSTHREALLAHREMKRKYFGKAKPIKSSFSKDLRRDLGNIDKDGEPHDLQFQ